jgi:hypothetical protein
MTAALHVDVQQRTSDHPIGYQQPCALCGQAPSRLRVLEWRPPLGPKGVPAWSVRASHYCQAHRAEAVRLAASLS